MPKENYSFELKLVKTVEQHPCLYNFQLPEYKRRDSVNAAWFKVSQEMNESVQECKDKWRTLRITYTRSIKLPPKNVMKLSQKTKDMMTEMDFIRPYVTTKNQELQNNLIPLPFSDENSAESLEEIDEETQCIPLESSVKKESLEIEATGQHTSAEPPAKRKKQQSFGNSGDVDLSVINYENPKRLFLLSLLPDLEQMNDRQMRRFRSKVCGIIDDILTDGEYTPNSSCPTEVTWKTEPSEATASTNFI